MSPLLLALSLLGPIGCADERDVDAMSANATDGRIDYEPWAEPMTIGLGAPLAIEVGYAQCETTDTSVDEGEDGVINVEVNVDCGPAWAEVAWFELPAAALADVEGDQLALTFGTDDVVRASVRSVHEDGTTKLAVEHALREGDQLTAPLQPDAAAYHIYVARGRTEHLVWATGTISFTMTATTETGPVDTGGEAAPPQD